MQLLTTFLRTYEPKTPDRTALEQRWHDRIHGESDKLIEHAFRFIYFEMNQHQTDPVTFHDAINTLFERDIPILWESETAGVIIEDILTTNEEIHLEHIIPILSADLSVNLRFFVGMTHDEHDSLDETYHEVLQTGKHIFTLTNKLVIHEIEAIPYLLIQALPSVAQQKLAQSILQLFHEDKEMLETLHAFFSSNLNISETAKKMYMHRNSLQYRLDKFSRETGIHVQNFPEAVAVHLALLARIGLTD
jgi:DNA-binding PucR family transcriptional regulator